MNRRLNPQRNEWIDRTQPIEFTLEGRPLSGFRGDVIASALYANDVTAHGRSFKYHRPRGSYSYAGPTMPMPYSPTARAPTCAAMQRPSPPVWLSPA